MPSRRTLPVRPRCKRLGCRHCHPHRQLYYQYSSSPANDCVLTLSVEARQCKNAEIPSSSEHGGSSTSELPSCRRDDEGSATTTMAVEFARQLRTGDRPRDPRYHTSRIVAGMVPPAPSPPSVGVASMGQNRIDAP